MYLACSSQSYDDLLGSGKLGLTDWLRLCAEELGLAAVELEDKHVGEPTPGRLDALAEVADRHNLQIVNIAFMNNFGVADEERRRLEEVRAREWIGVALRLKSRFLRVFAGWPEGDRKSRWADMIASLKLVLPHAEDAGLRLVLENHDHGGFVQTAADVEAILQQVGSPALGLLLDTGNYVDGLASIERTARFAWHVHAKFARVAEDGRDLIVDHERVVPILREAGYRGCLSIEYEGPEPGRAAVPRIVGYLKGMVEGNSG